jgi:hypothetical protein
LLFVSEQNKNLRKVKLAESDMGRSVALTLHQGAARPLPGNWRRLLADLPEDARDLFEERAALIEYDGGEKRKTAERRAFECVIGQNAAAAALFAAFCAQAGAGAGEIPVCVS